MAKSCLSCWPQKLPFRCRECKAKCCRHTMADGLICVGCSLGGPLEKEFDLSSADIGGYFLA